MRGRLIWLLAAATVVLAGCGKKIDTPPENYTAKIPGMDIEIEMVYVPGGEFEMGAPEGAPHRKEDEGPVRRVKVGPYWIGKTEVTWDQYEAFAFVKDSTMLDAITLASAKLSLTWFHNFRQWGKQRIHLWKHGLDAVSRPSNYYGAYDHGMGRGQKPAIGISWIGATYFCKWLSKKTGHEYRLPTEAEWEFACRAGDSEDMTENLDQYAWYEDNSNWESQPVGRRKPNAFGLHDMLGNAWELCFEEYDSLYFDKLKAGSANRNPVGPKWWVGDKASLRGGSWDDPVEEARPTNRLQQLDWWTERDPQRPRGIWWLIDGNTVGFRVLRPAY